MRLHIMTGGKGGTGKTLCALSAITHYLNLGLRVLSLDLNNQNADLWQILYPLGENEKQIVKKGIVFLPSYEGRNILARPINSYIIDYQHLWNSIESSILYTFEEKYLVDVIVIDTGFHLSNLNPRNLPDNIAVLRHLNNTFQTHGVKKLNIWFSWTISDFLRAETLESMQKTLTHIESQIPIFDPVKDLIHVLNPSNLYPRTRLLDVYVKGLKSIVNKDYKESIEVFGLRMLSQRQAIRSVSFQELSSTMKEVLSSRNLNSQETIEFIWELLARNLYKKFPGRPQNLFLLPKYEPSLAGYTDSLMLERYYSTRELMYYIQSAYEPISQYLLELEK